MDCWKKKMKRGKTEGKGEKERKKSEVYENI
jgi:hypothetical protein